MNTDLIKGGAPAGTDKAEASMKFTKFEVTTDGTVGGTKILLNGKVIDNLSSLDFCFYSGNYGGVNLSFCTSDKSNNPGEFVETHRYYLNPPIPDKAEASISTTEPAPSQMARPDPAAPMTRKQILESM